MNDEQLNNIRLYTRAEAAKALSISKKSLNDLINDGSLGVLMIKNQMYIPHIQLVKFIQTNTITLQRKLNEDSDEIALEKFRRETKTSTIDSVNILNNIMDKNNGKYIY